ncbi:hypothetical protein RA280_47110 [Cupriavidus sp. CV2]|uniref:hypothetical protein n=1 Tax=Cupriavidus ulmosensis TaxID=3065913 RepID=UPI00296B1BDB|nr:hypothetical protein [Cupriavidus sp. CV2]MDW3689158.1 hypothetical protein [Cupriavidus sp. CV2]
MLSWTLNKLIGLFRRQSSTPAAPSTRKNTAVRSSTPEEAFGSVFIPNPHLVARRAQALQCLFPRLSSWFASTRDSLCISEINEYLAQASNVTDLDQRVRVIEQRRHASPEGGCCCDAAETASKDSLRPT